MDLLTQAAQPKRWRIAALLGVGVLVNYFDRVNISVAHDALHAEFGISTVTFGYLLSAFTWTYALLQLPMGVCLDFFGVKRIGRIAAFLWSVASFGAAAATGVGSFFSMRLLLGVGEAPTFPANAKAVGLWFAREERSFATAVFDAAAKFGPAVGVPLVGYLLYRFGWRISFAATGLLSFFYFLAFFAVYRDPDNPSPHAPAVTPRGAPLGYLLRQKKILGLVGGFFGYNYSFYLLLFWMPTYFGSLHLNGLDSALFTSIPWLVATATDLFVGGWLVDHLIKRGYKETLVRQSILIGGSVLGMAIVGATFTRDPIVAVVWISIAIGGLAAAAPVGWSIPSLIAPPNSVGSVGGILNFGNQIAGAAAPIVTGYFAGLSGSFAGAFTVAALLLLLGIAGYIFLLGEIVPVPEPMQSAVTY